MIVKLLIKRIALIALKTSYIRRYSTFWYKLLGVNFVGGKGKIHDPRVYGDFHNIFLGKNAEINKYCFLLAKDKIIIGENSTLAYGTTILTSANPNGPYNQLSKIYPAMHAPVIIGNNVWIGSNAIILPGVTIGDMSVVAAGSVVTKDIPKGVLVAGNPAVIKKKLI